MFPGKYLQLTLLFDRLGSEQHWKTKSDFAVCCILTIFALLLHIVIIISINVTNFVLEKKVISTFVGNINAVLFYLVSRSSLLYKNFYLP